MYGFDDPEEDPAGRQRADRQSSEADTADSRRPSNEDENSEQLLLQEQTGGAGASSI